jgi:hypothetical protein
MLETVERRSLCNVVFTFLVEFYDSPRMLKLAAQEGRLPFVARSSSSGGSSQNQSDVEDDNNGPVRKTISLDAAANGALNGDVSDDEDDTYTFQVWGTQCDLKTYVLSNEPRLTELWISMFSVSPVFFFIFGRK